MLLMHVVMRGSAPGRAHRAVRPGALAASACLLALVLSGCQGPVDVTFINTCHVPVRLQTYDGSGGRDAWVPDEEPLVDVTVEAGLTLTVHQALQFSTVPEEIRILEPTEESFLISVSEDLGAGNSWQIPSGVCVGASSDDVDNGGATDDGDSDSGSSEDSGDSNSDTTENEG